MEKPPKFVVQGELGKVCRLYKAIYGLKNLATIQVSCYQSNQFVFSSTSKREMVLFINYVDDIIIPVDDYKGIVELTNSY